MKPGTRVEILNCCGVPNEFGRIVRWHRDWKGHEDKKPVGFHPVRFDGPQYGCGLLIHESQLRVIDNRP